MARPPRAAPPAAELRGLSPRWPTATCADKPEMLVYGDRWRAAAPSVLLDDLARRLAAAGARRRPADRGADPRRRARPGRRRRRGRGRRTDGSPTTSPPGHAATLALAIAVAARLLAARGLPAPPSGLDPDAALARVRALPLPPAIRCRTAGELRLLRALPGDLRRAAAAAGLASAAARHRHPQHRHQPRRRRRRAPRLRRR